MTDFLANLAARALARPSLQPRTRSRFEPSPDASPWPAAMATASIEPEAEAPLQSARRRVRGSEEIAADSESAGRQAPSLEQPRSEPFPKPRPAARTETVATNTEKANVASHTVQTTERVLERVIEKHDTTVRVEAPAPSNAESEQRRDSSLRHRYDEEQPRIEREDRDPHAPFAASEARPSTRQAPVDTFAALEPIIHVSIGRVEVRAVAPAATPQRARAHHAPMTIEDYAARRKAKGRP